jgi:hypothetical protein
LVVTVIGRALREGAQSRVAIGAIIGMGVSLILDAIDLSFALRLAVGVATLCLGLWWFALYWREPHEVAQVAGHCRLEAGEFVTTSGGLASLVGEAWQPDRVRIRWQPETDVAARVDGSKLLFSRRSSDAAHVIVVEWWAIVYNRDLPVEWRAAPFYRA